MLELKNAEVDANELLYLKRIGMPMKDIARLLRVSRQTLYNTIRQSGSPSIFATYTEISDPALDAAISRIKEQHPNNGEVMICGYLMAEGIRVPRSRVRASIHRVDPVGVEERRRRAVRRRVYTVPHPNHVWHIDGNHKLIRWKLVIHGCIDGYSRLIPYLTCATNNRAITVVGIFEKAVETYGVPNHVRSDRGGENVNVWRYMLNHHQSERCVIVGSSTHNERIERLWRDVSQSVVQPFSTTFRSLESQEDLDPLNLVDIYCLHYVFLPRINKSLESFLKGWNDHKISTEHNRTALCRWTYD